MYLEIDCDRLAYYEAIQVNVYESGYYTFASDSSIDIDGYMYEDIFHPFRSTANLISKDYYSCINLQFRITVDLQINTTYILVVTTYSLNVSEPFSIIVSATNNTVLELLSEYIFYL
jgi:hypothetical protein